MQKFVKATMTITIFAVLTRAFGFLLRIFLSRVMGAETLGSYQISMSVFGVLMTIIASGLPLVVSRNVSYYEGKDEHAQRKNISAGLIVGLVVSVAICGLFFALGGVLTKILSEDSVNMIFILLPTLVVSSVYVVLRGAMWGKKYFFTISFTEFFEQIVRIVAVAVLFAIPLGLSSGQKSALSLTLSAIASCLLVCILFFAFGGRLAKTNGEIKNIVKTSLPITMVRTVSSVIGSIIAIILPARLMMFGYTRSEALSIFGEYMGMTLPLIMVPTTFVSSIAVALVPELSGLTNNVDKTGEKSRKELSQKITRAIQSTIAISFVLMPAFLALGVPICQILFSNKQAGNYLVLSAILMLPMGINQICSSVLNAIGLEKKELMHYVAGALVLVACVFVLPQLIGGNSIFVGMLCMHTISALLSIISLKKRKLISFDFVKTIAICAGICLSTTLLTKFCFGVLSKFVNLFVATLISGAICEIFVILLMIVFNVSNIKILMLKVGGKAKKAKQKTIA